MAWGLGWMGKRYLIAQPWAATQEQTRIPAEVDEIERISPARQPTLESDVLVPMAWSIITGAMAAFVLVVLLVVNGSPLWPALSAGMLVTVAAWLWK